MLNLYLHIRIVFMDAVFNSLRYTTGYRIATTGCCCIMQMSLTLNCLRINATCLKHGIQFLKCNNKIHVTTDCFSHCFQFFCCTRSDKHNFCIRMFFLNASCSCNHRSQLLGYTVNNLRELFLCQHGPCRTARCKQERFFSCFYMVHIIMCLSHCSDIRTKCYLIYL